MKQITEKYIPCLQESFTNYFWGYSHRREENKGPTRRASLLTIIFCQYFVKTIGTKVPLDETIGRVDAHVPLGVGTIVIMENRNF